MQDQQVIANMEEVVLFLFNWFYFFLSRLHQHGAQQGHRWGPCAFPSLRCRSLESHQEQSCFFSKWKSVLPSWEDREHWMVAAASDPGLTPSFPGLQIPQLCSPPPVMQNLQLCQPSICSHTQVQHLSLSLGTTSHLLPIQTVPEGRPYIPPTLKMDVWSRSTQPHALPSRCSDGFKNKNVTQDRPTTLKAMTFHGTQEKEKHFPVESMVRGF